MYIQGFVTPVPEGNQDRYVASASAFWEIAKDYGAIEQVEGWEADVRDGQHTDFRRAVDLQPGERVAFSWVLWPDRASADDAYARMMADPRMEALDMPFDGKRLIIGGFSALMVRGR